METATKPTHWRRWLAAVVVAVLAVVIAVAMDRSSADQLEQCKRDHPITEFTEHHGLCEMQYGSEN